MNWIKGKPTEDGQYLIWINRGAGIGQPDMVNLVEGRYWRCGQGEFYDEEYITYYIPIEKPQAPDAGVCEECGGSGKICINGVIDEQWVECQSCNGTGKSTEGDSNG